MAERTDSHESFLKVDMAGLHKQWSSDAREEMLCVIGIQLLYRRILLRFISTLRMDFIVLVIFRNSNVRIEII